MIEFWTNTHHPQWPKNFFYSSSRYQQTDILVSFLFGLADNHFLFDNGKANCSSVGMADLELDNFMLDASSDWQFIKMCSKQMAYFMKYVISSIFNSG